MPRYDYRCLKCDSNMIINHGMDDAETDCPLCEEKGSLIKEISFFTAIKKEFSKKTGDIVKEFIEESKEEISKEKKKLKSRGH